MNTRVVFLAFANSQSHPLPTLNKEDEDVFSTLVNRILKGHFIVHRQSFATLESVSKRLDQYADNLAIFHYSGHADSNTMLLDEKEANAEGIAYQLKRSAQNGVLKLVILNGCSTVGQVRKLMEFGVPAVIATHAPVDDSSATEFAIRFFQNVSEKDMTIKNAFLDALGPAQTATRQKLVLGDKIVRHIDFLENPPSNLPLWKLFYENEEAIEINPLPNFSAVGPTVFTPNKLLNETLFNTLHKEGNAEIRKIKEREETDYVELADKQNAIVNALPFPVGIHIQRLFSPSENDDEGYDKVNQRRIKQIAEVFHTTMELMGFVMLSQLWELKLKNLVNGLPEHLLNFLKQYFYLTSQQRSSYDYVPLIRTIREYFDSLNNGEGITYFINELNVLKESIRENHPFANSCSYLTHLRQQTMTGMIAETEVATVCEKAEENLCVFFQNIGFLHRYNLTSIQNINIIKYRHNVKAEFNHAVIKLMRAVGKPDRIYYKWSSYLDNQGVILLKGDLQLSDASKRQFIANNLEFLNLSPFIIDRNAFEPNTDLTSLMFFEQYRKTDQKYRFKTVRRPNSAKDQLDIGTEDKYEVIRLEFGAFHSMILNEHL